MDTDARNEERRLAGLAALEPAHCTAVDACGHQWRRGHGPEVHHYTPGSTWARDFTQERIELVADAPVVTRAASAGFFMERANPFGW